MQLIVQNSHESRFDEIRIGNTFAEAFSGTTGIAYEGFNYPTGTGTLGGSNGGYGWGTPWKVTSGNKDNVASGSFTFPGVTSSGNRGEIRGTVNRTLLNNIQRTSGSVWMGFFIWNTNSSRTSRLRLSEQGGTRFGSLTEFQQGTGLDLNSKQTDPQFVDEANNNYRLASTSPAIDMGTTLTFNSDYEGNTRPQGNEFDVGAYESSFTNTESAPSVSITSPANNSSFTAGSDIVISASTSDADGSVVKVEFFNGFLKLGEDTTAPFDFTWSNVISGNYTLYAVATDNDGNITTSAGVNISSTGCVGCRQADDLKEASEVVIYPNAAVADFYVRIKTPQSAMAEIVITDLKGLVVKNRLVQLQEGDNTIGFQKGSMQEGVYMVKIESAHERIIKKLVVLE